jgi:hypothetical protein
MAKIDAGAERLTFAKRRPKLQPHERLCDPVHTDYRAIDQGATKRRRCSKADRELEPGSLYFVIQIWEWELSEVTAESF